MPIPIAIGAAAAQAGGNIISQGINAIVQGATNRASRRFSEKMYGRQREDALADYHMQNEYNSPAALMQRYKDAQLNPHLIYGQGTQSSSPIRSSSAPSWSPEAPRIDLRPGDAIGTFLDAKFRTQQTDNLLKQNMLLDEEIRYKQAATLGLLTNNEASNLKLGMSYELRNTQIETQKKMLEKLENDIQEGTGRITYAFNEDQRKTLQNTANLQEAAARILQMGLVNKRIKAEIDNALKDGTLKQLDIDMRQKGIMPGDPLYMRMLNRVVTEGVPSPNKLPNWLKIDPINQNKR